MVESTIDKIKDITVERQIRKLAGIIDEQNDTIANYGDATTDIQNLKDSDANQTTQINNLKQSVETNKQGIEYTVTEIDNLKESDTNQTTQINNLKQSVAADKLATESAITGLQSKDAEQDGTLANHATLIQGITESLVSDVQIMSGTTTGEIKVRLEREAAAVIDSNNYNLGLPVSAEIIQGTGPSMFKIQITMSTGVKVISNDFVFTTEAIGNDIYISSFTFKAGNQDGYLSADIGLNNGVTIEANNFLVPTDPNVTSAIADLQNRVSAVEGGGVVGLDELKATVEGHTTSINELNTDVADLRSDKADVNNSNQSITAKTINATNINKNGVSVATVNDIPSVPDISGKADLNNSSQTIVAGTINATNINKSGVSVATVNDIPDISGKVDKAQGTENAGKILVVGNDGNVAVGDAVSKIPYENLGYIIPTFDVITDSVISPTLFSSSSNTNYYLIDPLKMYLYNDSIVLAGCIELPGTFKESLSISYGTANDSYFYMPEEMRAALIGKKFKIAGNSKIYYMARYGTIKFCFRANITTDRNNIITAVNPDGLIASNTVISIPLGTKLHFTPVCATNNITYAYSYDNPVPNDYIPLNDFI